MSAVTSATPHRPPPKTRGWWRRNLWGLVVMLPLVAALFATNADVFIERNLTLQPREPLEAPVGQVVEYADADVRLVSFTNVDPTVRVVGRDHTLPAGLVIWQSVFDVDPHDAESLVQSSRLWVEDAQGRIYSNHPTELRGVDNAGIGGLSPDTVGDLDAPTPAPDAPFTSTSYYVLPAEVQPVAVRVVYEPALPRYVRFTVG